MLLNMTLDQESAATSKSKVLFQQSRFYMTECFYSKTLVSNTVVTMSCYSRLQILGTDKESNSIY